MSTQSRLRNEKKPTPVSGRPRLFGAISKNPPINLTDLQKSMHADAEAAKNTPKKVKRIMPISRRKAIRKAFKSQ